MHTTIKTGEYVNFSHLKQDLQYVQKLSGGPLLIILVTIKLLVSLVHIA